MGPRLKVSPERLEKPGIEPTTPGLESEQLNHYATEEQTIADKLALSSPTAEIDPLQLTHR